MSYLGQAPSNAVLTSSQLADGVVTTPKLADNAVTDVKVSAITLLDRSINTTANIALSKLADGSSITLANVNNAWVKAQAGYTVSSTETGAFTFNYDTYQNFIVTLGANITFTNPTTENVGQSGIIVLVQGGSGSYTLSLGTDYETVGGAGITLSTAAGSVDVLPYYVKAVDSIQLGGPQLAFS
jgi:cobyrinic acid a,c-diamide synthase